LDSFVGDQFILELKSIKERVVSWGRERYRAHDQSLVEVEKEVEE